MNYKFEILPEIHCDECNEIVHNHFSCLICNNENTGTNIYSEMCDEIDKDGKIEVECEECGSIFMIKDTKDICFYDENTWELKSLMK